MKQWLLTTFTDIFRRQPLLLPVLSTAVAILLTEYLDSWLFGWFLALLILLWGLAFIYRKTCAGLCVILSLLAGWKHWDSLRDLEDQLAFTGQRVELLGVVNEEPGAWREFSIEVVQGHAGLEGKTLMVQGHALFEESVSIGEKVWLKGKLRTPDKVMNPDERDVGRWLKRKDISLLLDSEEMVKTEAFSDRYILSRWSNSSRNWIKTQLTNGIENTPAEKMVLAVFLGEKPTSEKEMMHDFRVSGTMHIFAVSGLHVILIGCIVALVLRVFGAPSWVWVPLVISTMFFYAVVTGMRPPAMRAVLMSAVYLLGILFLRKPSLLNSLWLSAIVALVWNGHSLFMPSFQFSYAVLIMIALTVSWFSNNLKWITYSDPFLPPVLRNFRQRMWLGMRRRTARAAAVSGAAWCGSAPLAWLYFGIITPLSILASVPLVLIVFFMLSVSCLSLLLGIFSSDAQRWVNQINAKQADLAHVISNKAAEIPYGHYQRAKWQEQESIVIYQLPEGGMAAYINIGGGVMLDTGNADTYYQHIYPSMTKNKALLDAVIITHADAKHSGGAVPLIERSSSEQPIKQVMMDRSQARNTQLKKITRLASEKGAAIIHPSFKQKFTISENASFQILSDSSDRGQTPANDAVLVILLEWQGKKILFLSDAGFEFERWWVENGWELDVDTIVMGKHAKEPSLSPDFLRQFSPETIIATNDMHPAEEHREPRWIERIQQSGITLHLLNQSGTVTLTNEEDSLNTSFITQ